MDDEKMNLKLDGASDGHGSQRASLQSQMPANESELTQGAHKDPYPVPTHEQSAATRHEKIAVAAYFIAESRGFAPGHDEENWLLAQAQVDARHPGFFDIY